MPNITITAVKGIRTAALHCGIKESGKPDLALLVSDVPAAAAAVFTTNKVVGAPVLVGRRHIQHGILRACITNSGCANVCTGQRGIDDALEMCALTADGLAKLSGDEVPASAVLPFSTGVIGRFLPMDKIRAGIPQAFAQLSNTQEAGEAFALGILTTDLVPKSAHASLTLGGKRVTIAGHCKGSGMIAPNMALPPQATMLAYVATDASIPPATLRKLIAPVADQTFNCVTVDQHTSTSDTFVLLATGLSGSRKLTASPDLAKFSKALLEVCDSLARQIARDGEGATKLVTVTVTGAKSPQDARRAADAIANSPLCKTAIHGGDPNWGRFVSAAGYSGAAMNPDRASCKIGNLTVFKNGQPTAADLAAVEKIMQQEKLAITVDLGTPGKSSHRTYTCDLSRDYITINADYHT
ncbi:MAG TPA: bifunctional glutamate N-acetyltransferase/amino-acid acetyltransferase ArgJ [Phycisphaerae bacterium]|nr:bifunctional glutamate N-acetyltransferase/amino-acid acetyltransferase ArgJ [Phycisphaerae bacterium]